jgi:hypothetical protein
MLDSLQGMKNMNSDCYDDGEEKPLATAYQGQDKLPGSGCCEIM